MQDQQVDGQKILEAIQQQRNQAHDEVAQLRAYIQLKDEYIQKIEARLQKYEDEQNQQEQE